MRSIGTLFLLLGLGTQVFADSVLITGKFRNVHLARSVFDINSLSPKGTGFFVDINGDRGRVNTESMHCFSRSLLGPKNIFQMMIFFPELKYSVFVGDFPFKVLNKAFASADECKTLVDSMRKLPPGPLPSPLVLEMELFRQSEVFNQ